MRQYLALDLGAESRRAIAGTLDNGRLKLEELHRFPNTLVREADGLYWDMPRLREEIFRGIRIAAVERGLALAGIGVDTWGVDCSLLGEDGELVERPRHY